MSFLAVLPELFAGGEAAAGAGEAAAGAGEAAAGGAAADTAGGAAVDSGTGSYMRKAFDKGKTLWGATWPARAAEWLHNQGQGQEQGGSGAANGDMADPNAIAYEQANQFSSVRKAVSDPEDSSSPSSVKERKDTEDPEKVDPHEKNDGDTNSWQKDPATAEGGGSYGPFSENVFKEFLEALPDLLSGQAPPEKFMDIHHKLDAESPGYLDRANPDHEHHVLRLVIMNGGAQNGSHEPTGAESKEEKTAAPLPQTQEEWHNYHPEEYFEQGNSVCPRCGEPTLSKLLGNCQTCGYRIGQDSDDVNVENHDPHGPYAGQEHMPDIVENLQSMQPHWGKEATWPLEPGFGMNGLNTTTMPQMPGMGMGMVPNAGHVPNPNQQYPSGQTQMQGLSPGNCPHCGATTEPSQTTCPQCHTSLFQSPVQQRQGAQQGPVTPEQVLEVQKYLIQNQRPNEVPRVVTSPQDYARELALIQKRDTPPVLPDNTQEPPMPQPEPQMQEPDQMPPQQAMASRFTSQAIDVLHKHFASDEVAPRCPRCNSATTKTVDTKNGKCHACGKVFPIKNMVKDEVVQKGSGWKIALRPNHNDPNDSNPTTETAQDQDQQIDPMAQDSSQSWADSGGNPLVAGQTYKVFSPSYPIPDVMRVTAVKPHAIEVEEIGAYGLGFAREIPLQEAHMQQLQFEPTEDAGAHQEKEFAALENNDDHTGYDGALSGGADDLSTPHMTTGKIARPPQPAPDPLDEHWDIDRPVFFDQHGYDATDPIRNQQGYIRGDQGIPKDIAHDEGYENIPYWINPNMAPGQESQRNYNQDRGLEMPPDLPPVWPGKNAPIRQGSWIITAPGSQHLPGASPKRNRQYEHIKEQLMENGKSEEEAKEEAARTVNKQRSEHGETKGSKMAAPTSFMYEGEPDIPAGMTINQWRQQPRDLHLEGRFSCPDCGAPIRDKEDYRQHLMTEHSNDDNYLNQFAPQAKTAGAAYTPHEQQTFIDEEGEARNLDTLNLAGTHYEAGDDFLFSF